MPDDDKAGDEATESHPWWGSPWVLGLAFGGGALFVLIAEITLESLEQRAQFGDAFAPLTGLLTAGALVASLWAVTMQRQELRLQRQEMAAQRDEARRSREHLEQQAQAQRFLAYSQAAAVRVSALEALSHMNAAAIVESKVGDVRAATTPASLTEAKEFQAKALWAALRQIDPVVDDLQKQLNLDAHK